MTACHTMHVTQYDAVLSVILLGNVCLFLFCIFRSHKHKYVGKNLVLIETLEYGRDTQNTTGRDEEDSISEGESCE